MKFKNIHYYLYNDSTTKIVDLDIESITAIVLEYKSVIFVPWISKKVFRVDFIIHQNDNNLDKFYFTVNMNELQIKVFRKLISKKYIIKLIESFCKNPDFCMIKGDYYVAADSPVYSILYNEICSQEIYL